MSGYILRPTGRMVPLMATTPFLVVSPMAGPRGAPSTHEQVSLEDKGATTQERLTQAVIPPGVSITTSATFGRPGMEERIPTLPVLQGLRCFYLGRRLLGWPML